MKRTFFVYVVLSLFISACSFEKDIFKVVAQGSEKEVSAVLKNIKDINVVNNDGWNLLLVASSYNSNSAVIKKLIDAGIDVNSKSPSGISPLLVASMNNKNPEVLKVLLDAGADVNSSTEDGVNAIMIASINNTSSVVKTLIEAGADLRAEDSDGTNSLMIAAAENKNPDVIKAIVNAGVINIDAQNDEGLTALMIAALINTNPEIVLTLLDLGANITMRDNYGSTALDYSEQNKNLKGTSAYKRLIF